MKELSMWEGFTQAVLGAWPGQRRRFRRLSVRRFIVITVGLADPADEKNVQNIRKSALRQIPESLADKTEFYHLRGGIDYGKLSFKHRLMMKMLYEQAKKQPPDERDADTRAMIETYGQKVSFVNLECLENIMWEMKKADSRLI